MRLPFTKPWRAFPEFDGLSNEECRGHIRRAGANRSWLHVGVPMTVGFVVLVGWPVALMALGEVPSVRSYVPLPRSGEGWVLLLAISTPLLGLGVPLLIRDATLYLTLRAEVMGARCRKCGQSLLGLPVQSTGTEPDPAKQFVKCPECGRKWMLLDIGLTPRQLVPFEQREVRPDVAKRREGARW